MKKYSLYLLFFSFSSLAAIIAPSEKSSVSIEIGYTMGEHLLQAQQNQLEMNHLFLPNGYAMAVRHFSIDHSESDVD